MNIIQICIRLLAFFTLAFAIPAIATAATCGITGNASASAVFYDPFNPTGLATTRVSLTLQRVNGTGGQKTDIVSFFLRGTNSTSDGVSIIPKTIAVEGNFSGLDLDIFYDFLQSPPTVAPTSLNPTSANQFFKIEFTGNNAASDFATVGFDVTLPANLNLQASQSLAFDAIFACSTTGGGAPTQQTGSISNAIVFPVTVLSALQASYVGTALDFGDITNVTTASLPSGTYQKFGNIRVASSGAYQITAHSQNNFRLVSSGGNANTPAQSLHYTATLVGEARIGVSGNGPVLPDINKVCSRAGIGGQLLPLTASLTEGPMAASPTKVTSVYSDILTITVTPQVDTVAGTAC